MNTVIKRRNPRTGTQMIRRLVLTAYALDRHFTADELRELKSKVFRRTTGSSFVTVRADATIFGEVVLFFDLYSVEQLTFAQRLRHYLRMVKATVFDHMGISTGIVIIKR